MMCQQHQRQHQQQQQQDECDFTPAEIRPQHESCSIESFPSMEYSEVSFADDQTTIVEASALKTTRQHARFGGYSRSSLGLLVSAVVVALSCLGESAYKAATTQLAQVENERQELLQTQERLLLQLAKDKRIPMAQQDKTDSIVEHVKLLQQQLEATSQALEQERQKMGSVKYQVDEAWDKVSHLTTELSHAESQMHQDQSLLFRNLAEQQFGPGPHYAEFQLQRWHGTVKATPVTETFTIEFAPLDVMPATVYLLLRQIDQGLWDQTSIHLNAPHALLAHPRSATGDDAALRNMERLGLARLPFSEYSERYPHEAYTLGLGGRVLPGPNFFINKMDNTDNHKDQPCFAKIVDGHATIDALSQMTGQDGQDPYYIQQVEIQSVRLVQR